MFNERDAKAINKLLTPRDRQFRAYVNGLCTGIAFTAAVVGGTIVFLLIPVLP